jgi:hypothetical protein
MSCILNSGFQIGCADQIGGIKSIYIASFTGSTSYTYDADNVITGITGTNNYYTFEQRNETAEFIETGNHSVENGTNFWTQTVSLVFSKNDTASRNTLKLLAQSELSIIVLDQNGNYWNVAQENGANLTSSTVGAGKAYGDLSGSNLTLEGKEACPARQISAAAFASDIPVT